jgi:putative protease
MKPEILAPAGTPEKLETALHFGADAVYLGLKEHSLRSAAGNFDLDQLRWALQYAHRRERRVYVCVNIQPFDSDLDRIERALGRIAGLRPDGIIVADPAVLTLARRHAPAIPLHLSTQTSVTNVEAARFWLGQGVQRLIVARELSLEQLARLVAGCSGEVEAFVHGAVCIAWSGRCLLSLYWAGRDPRRGACAQGCRWAYRVAIEDTRRPGELNPVEQDQRGTYFFDAKDLCALPVLDRLLAAGVHALKIEGRTRSSLYVGTTVDVYRHAVDLIASGDLEGFREQQEALIGELRRPANRGFSTHFLTGEQVRVEAYNPEGSFPDGRARYIGRVTGRRSGGLLLELHNPVRAGDQVELRDRGLVCEPVSLEKIEMPDGEPRASARNGETILLRGSFRCGPGALARVAARARGE